MDVLGNGTDDCFYYYDSLSYSFNYTYLCNGTMIELVVNVTNNSSDNATCAVYSKQFSSPYIQAVIYVLYCTILVLALLGNGLVCYVVQSSPRMRTVTNYFIVNLAVGDLLMAVLCIPFTFVSTLLLQYWPFGQELCQIVSFAQAVSVFVSAYTLVAISIDRYMAIMWPLKPRMSKRNAKWIIAAVWLISKATALPILIVSKLKPIEKCGRYYCDEDWGSNIDYKLFYTIVLTVLQYVVPFKVLIYTYTRIAIVVWGKQIPGEAENSRDQRVARSKRKMIKMMVIVVIVFTVCWLPFNILSLMMMNYPELSKWKYVPYLFAAFHWLAMSHSCYNPVIYCWMNARFRLGFCAALDHVPGLGRLVPYVAAGTRGTRGRKCTSSGGPRGGHASMTTGHGHPVTGMDSEQTSLHRVNTCTTYVSLRRVNQTSLGMDGVSQAIFPPVRSASVRLSDDRQRMFTTQLNENHNFAEDQI